MAENLEFGLKLDDQISGAAKKAADALSKVESKANAAGKALSFDKEINKLQASLAKLKADPKGFQEIAKAAKELNEQRNKLKQAAGIAGKSFSETIGENLSFAKLTGAATLGSLLADGLVEGAKKSVELITEGVKFAFESAGKEEQLRLAQKLTLGDEGAKQAREEAEKIAPKTRFSENQVAEQLQQLFRGGFKPGEKANSAYALAGDLAAAQGTTGSGGVESNIDLLSRINLKGGVTGKQLTNLGIKSEDFFKLFGQGLGINTNTKAGKAQAEKAAESGKQSDRILNTLEALVNQRQGGLGGSGADDEAKTFEGRLAKLRSLPETFFSKLVDSPGFQKFKDTLTKVLEQLDPNSQNGQAIIGGLTTGFDKIADIVSKAFTPENIKGFADVVAGLVGTLAFVFQHLDSILKISRDLALVWVGGQLVSGITALAGVLPVLATGAGLIAGLSAPVLAAAAAFAALAAGIAYASHEFEKLGGIKQSFKDIGEFFSGENFSSGVDKHAPRPSLPGGIKNNSNFVINQEINVHPDKDDVNHTQQKMVEASHNAIVIAMERSGQETGASQQ